MPHTKDTKQGDVWRTCNKIRAAIFRMGINLFEYFTPLDPHKTCLISESQFISVLNAHFRSSIALSEKEVAELADYFRVPDGRIYYTQLCEVTQDNLQKSGVEKYELAEDSKCCNQLSPSEERRLSVLLTKIASMVNIRRLILTPYFQDYQLISKNNSTITMGHFARILTYLKLPISPAEYLLLTKKFFKDSYTMNYVAFLKSIDKVIHYLNKHKILDVSGDVMNIFPGRVTGVSFPKLPRPEINKVMASRVLGSGNKFNPTITEAKQVEHILNTLSVIQDHVFRYQLRVCDFFDYFDPLRCGKITVSQFHRGLDALALSGKQRLFLSLPDVEAVIHQYRDPDDCTRVCWKTFELDVNEIFNDKQMCTSKVQPTLKDLPIVDRTRNPPIESSVCSMYQNAIDKVNHKIIYRQLLLKPVFRDYDKHNNGHVSRNQMRQALHSNGILLSDDEFFALENRYINDIGFNYFTFLKDVEPKGFQDPLHTDAFKKNQEKSGKPTSRVERDIVQILTKIKAKVVRGKIPVLDTLKDFDKCNHQMINRADFKTGLQNCGFELSEDEIDTLVEVFGSPLNNQCVDYKRFSKVVEESTMQLCVEKESLLEPKEHVSTKDCEKNFLNFDERIILSKAIQKLSKWPDLQKNLSEVLQAFDKDKCGIVTQPQFLNALTLRGMYNLISSHEFDVICKSFSFAKGCRHQIDYKAFLKALDILYFTDKYNPF